MASAALVAALELVVIVAVGRVVVLLEELVLLGPLRDFVEVRVAVVCPAVGRVYAVRLHLLDPFRVCDAVGLREPLSDVLASWCAAVSSLVVAAFGVDGVVGVVGAVVCAATVCQQAVSEPVWYGGRFRVAVDFCACFVPLSVVFVGLRCVVVGGLRVLDFGWCAVLQPFGLDVPAFTSRYHPDRHRPKRGPRPPACRCWLRRVG